MSLPATPTDAIERRSLIRRGTALGSAGVVLAGGAAALLAAFPATAGATATITVDSSGDGVADANHCTDGTPNNCTLRDAAAAAVDGDTIGFEPSIGLITLTDGRITTQSVNIVGPGSSSLTITTTAHRGAYDLFLIQGSSDAVISGVTITKNRVVADNTGDFTFDDVTISGSTGSYGGALYGGNDADLFIIDSRFEGNFAYNNSGAVYIYNSHNTTISGTVFVDNTTQGDGGAVYSSNAVDITITDSEFSGNHADEKGGAIALYTGVTGVVTITDCTIDSNSSSTYGGGAFFGEYITAVVSNTTVSNNTANGASGLDFDGTGSTATINNSTITANSANNGGGAVYVNSGTSVTINQSTITANTSAGTSASYGGGGVSLGGPSSVLTLSGTIVSGNAAAVEGADDIGLYSNVMNQAGSFTSTNSIIGEVDSRITHNGTDDIDSTDPMLGALADNGGATMTMTPLPGSPAIDAGPNPVATFVGNDFDQRGTGYTRVSGGLVDIGAFEIQADPEPTTTTAPDEQVAPAFTG